MTEQESKVDQLTRERDQERQIYQQTVTEWRVRSQHWENVADDERRRRVEEETLRRDERRARLGGDRRYQDEISSLRREIEVLRMSASWNVQDGSFSSKTAPWGQMTPNSKEYPILPLPTPTHFDAAECKDCGTNGRCACIEQVLNTLPEPAAQNTAPTLNGGVKAYEAMEIDFTPRFAKKRANASEPPETVDQDSLMSMNTPMSSAEHCGFCTDDDNCICRASMLAAVAADNEPSNLASPPDSTYGERVNYMSKPQPVEPSLLSNGPGTCPACMADPDRRRFCQTLAGLMPPPPLPRQNSNNFVQTRFNESGFGAGKSDGRISCSDAYTELSKDPRFDEKKDSISFMQQLRTQPAQKDKDCNTCDSKGCSSYEVNCASVLAAMRGSGDTYGGNNLYQ